MRMRQFTPRQPPPDIRFTPQEEKPDLEVSLKHDDLSARAWECEYGKSVFDAENNNATPPSSPEILEQSGLSTAETWNTAGTAQERFRELFPPMEDLCDVTDTYPYMEPDLETSAEQPNISPTNPRSSKHNLRQNPKPKCNDDYR